MKKFFLQKKLVISFFALIFCSFQCIYSQTLADRGFAEDELRRGIQAYYRGSYNDAVIQFEKALYYLQDEGIILDWLGKAYYKAGIDGAAIQQWETARDSGYMSLLLDNRIQIVQERRMSTNSIIETIRYVESGCISNSDEYNVFYNQPISVLPEWNASFWVLAYGSNELLHFNVNEQIIDRIRGPLNGFDRPMDIIKLKNGNLAVSEYAGDRIALLNGNGSFIKSFGKKGRKDGELLGPQYLAQDSNENIFVTDFGNSRVSVFNTDGEYLFSFKENLKAPTGIAIVDNLVYVCDAVNGCIYTYDTNGNYLDVLVQEGTFTRPEALKVWKNTLLCSDSNRIVAVSLDLGNSIEIARIGNVPSRLTCSSPDVNGNIIVTDFNSSDIYILSPMNELVGGLFVQIERVISDKFPNVTLEVRVESRGRTPIVGLDESNFMITEEKRPVSNLIYTGAGNNNDYADITIVVDRSIQGATYSDAIESAVKEIAQEMNGKGVLRVVSAGAIPLTEFATNPTNYTNFTTSLLATPYTKDAKFDTSIRLAANDLIVASAKRAIVFLTSGNMPLNAFSKYTLADTTGYLNNNSISFVAVSLSNEALPDEIAYLADQTQGTSYYVYQKDGIGSIVKDIIDIPVGTYQFTYTSNLPTNFGKNYLPVEVELYLNNRSGREESGYFAPLE